MPAPESRRMEILWSYASPLLLRQTQRLDTIALSQSALAVGRNRSEIIACGLTNAALRSLAAAGLVVLRETCPARLPTDHLRSEANLFALSGEDALTLCDLIGVPPPEISPTQAAGLATSSALSRHLLANFPPPRARPWDCRVNRNLAEEIMWHPAFLRPRPGDPAARLTYLLRSPPVRRDPTIHDGKLRLRPRMMPAEFRTYMDAEYEKRPVGRWYRDEQEVASRSLAEVQAECDRLNVARRKMLGLPPRP